MGNDAFVAKLFCHVAAYGGADLELLVVSVQTRQVLHVGSDCFTYHDRLSEVDTCKTTEVGATTPGLFFCLVVTKRSLTSWLAHRIIHERIR